MGTLFNGWSANRSAARTVGLATAAIVTLGLVGCAADRPKPTALEAVTAQIAGRQVWSARVDSVQFPLAVATPADAFVVAGTDGTVLSLDAQSGRELWRGSAGDRLSAGVGSDGRFAAVVTRDNQLVVLDKAEDTLRFPGFGVDAARILVDERGAVGLGVDTLGIDPGCDEAFTVHRTVSHAKGLWHLENLTNLAQLPPVGAWVFVGVIKLVDGSGGPARVLALVP